MGWLAGQDMTAAAMNDVTVQVSTKSGLSSLSPVAGMPAWVTDLGLFGVYNGSAWMYGLQQLAATQILGASAASITFSSLPAVDTLMGVFLLRTDTGSGGSYTTMRFNGDSGNNYTWQALFGDGATVTSANAGGSVNGMHFSVAPGSGDTANYFAQGSFTVTGASGSTFKSMSSTFFGPIAPTNTNAGTIGGLWASTAAITSITLVPNSGNFVAGSAVALYGSM